jgi:hypothetical protein
MPRGSALPSDHERAAVTSAVAFLQDRLEQRATIEWALKLDTSNGVERIAVQHLLDGPRGWQIREPWQSAWRLIEESWETPVERRKGSGGQYRILERIKNGDRSGGLIAEIIDLVRPGIKVSPAQPARKTRHPRMVADLVSVWLTSGDVVDPAKIGVNVVRDTPFLIELAHGLDASVANGLDIANRLGWTVGHGLSRLGAMYRAYFVPAAERRDDEHEPDEFHRGIAPSVKLLYAAISALKEVDVREASNFARHWKSLETPPYIRLWAASARDARIAASADVGVFLRNCEDRQFWDVHYYPEITELRVSRFADLGESDKCAILSRLKKMPPRSHWPREADAARVKEARLFWVARELRRIEIMGVELPDNLQAWLAARLREFPELGRMSRSDEGFLGMPKARYVPPNPDNQYDFLEGTNRLHALEVALSSRRQGWDDDPAARAWDWIRQDRHAQQLLTDLEAASDGGAAYPKVWDDFGTALAAPVVGAGDRREGTDAAADIRMRRVLSLLEQLPDETLRIAIEGITRLVATWERLVVGIGVNVGFWFRLWPIAVSSTNDQPPVEAEPDFSIASGNEDREPMDLDTLNTPVGRLVGVFLAACPTVGPGDRPFELDAGLRAMRDAAVSAPGRSGIIARHRMIESLPWFLVADPDWSEDQLLRPLRAEKDEARALWRALARHTRFTGVLKVIGDLMADQATDRHLGRDTRRSLVWSLVIESLNAFWENREPAVLNSRIQQMLRSLDDEVRAHAAGALPGFVNSLSGQGDRGSTPPTAAELFRRAAQPFLEKVWPQERSLATPGVASAFASLPAASGDAFAEAVDAIERFLVPFQCWSMSDLGFHGAVDGEPRLSQINNEAKAEALLRLLDKAIGTAEDSVVPFDLPRALDQIQQLAPALVRSQKYRRLAALTRR